MKLIMNVPRAITAKPMPAAKAQAVAANAGWWTALFPPHGFTLASYQQVLAIDGVVVLPLAVSEST